jgi:putative ABC transport system permease protein
VKVKHSITISFSAIFTAAWFVVGFALLFIVDVNPWYLPQYFIPLLGMVLGNMLNGVSLGLETFLSSLKEGRSEIETSLLTGASSWEAALPFLQRSIRTGLIPMTNTMMVAGLVSIPGMMTGQLLAGVDPKSAVKYQIVVMFLIFSATALGTVLACFGMYRKLFSRDNRFLFGTNP